LTKLALSQVVKHMSYTQRATRHSAPSYRALRNQTIIIFIKRKMTESFKAISDKRSLLIERHSETSYKTYFIIVRTLAKTKCPRLSHRPKKQLYGATIKLTNFESLAQLYCKPGFMVYCIFVNNFGLWFIIL